MDSTEQPSAPLTLHGGSTKPEWIDYNGHMMDGYYFVAFTQATDALLEYLGFGPRHRERTGCTIYTVEGHINFLREVRAGTGLKYTTQILGYDSKRIHVFHSMILKETNELVATNELMFVHVNQATMKVEPMPCETLARLEKILTAHASLPRPANAGRGVGLNL